METPPPPPRNHVPATTCWGRLTGQWSSPADMYQIQPVEEDSLASGVPLQTCTRYNLLRKTHWPVESPCRHVPDTTCWGRLTGQWSPPADMYQIQPVEEDSLASGVPLQTCTRYDCWGRLTGQWSPPADMYQIQLLRKTHWPVESPCRHVPDTTCWGRLTGQETAPPPPHPPVNMSQLQHAEEDSVARGDPHPHPHPPCRSSSTTLDRKWREQLDSTVRACPCDQPVTRSRSLSSLDLLKVCQANGCDERILIRKLSGLQTAKERCMMLLLFYKYTYSQLSITGQHNVIRLHDTH